LIWWWLSFDNKRLLDSHLSDFILFPSSLSLSLSLSLARARLPLFFVEQLRRGARRGRKWGEGHKGAGVGGGRGGEAAQRWGKKCPCLARARERFSGGGTKPHRITPPHCAARRLLSISGHRYTSRPVARLWNPYKCGDGGNGGDGGGGGSGGGGGEREAAGHIDYPRRVVCYRTTRMSDVTADLPINALNDRRFLRIPPGGLIFNRCLITVKIARHFDPIT